MTDLSHAIFLSYASQDAEEEAQRICNALRAAGMEVCVDQSEFGGHIRRALELYTFRVEGATDSR